MMAGQADHRILIGLFDKQISAKLLPASTWLDGQMRMYVWYCDTKPRTSRAVSCSSTLRTRADGSCLPPGL